MKLSPKRSIRLRFTLIVLAMLFSFMAIHLFMNINFLERYYQNQKKDTAIETIDELNEIMNSYDYDGNKDSIQEAMSSEVEALLRKCWATYNMSFMVLSTENEVLFNSAGFSENLYERFQDLIFDKGSKVKVLYSNDYYKIVLASDRRGTNYFLSGFGFLDSGCSFLVSMPVESIHESADISNRFFLYVGIITLLISGMITFVLMKRLTRPVKELSGIASRMANLDFEASYNGVEEDEIGELGSSMNHMSAILKQTIEELKEANEKLQKDNEELQKVDEMRKDFLSGVSHELKTPIAIIQGYAEGLQDCVNEDEESRSFYCDVIMDEASKMNRMVQKLLKLNQLEFQDSMLERISFDLKEMIENMLQSFSVLIQDKKGRVEFRYDQPEILVYADAFLIEEVLQNYISNACNHLTRHGLILVQAHVVEGDLVRVEVFNEGEHIPEESLSQVWAKFYKVDKARTRAYGGSGIGLSLVKAVMDQHGNRYGVENVDNGVTFWFELPLDKEQTDGSY